MGAELIAELAVGVALAGLMQTALRGVRLQVRGVLSDDGDHCERLARREGLFQGFADRSRSDSSS